MRLIKIFLISAIFISMIFVPNTIFAQITGDVITGESVTGEAITGDVAQDFSVALGILATPPTLTISKPENETYFDNVSIILEVETTGKYVWYNLNNGENTTFTQAELDNKIAYFGAAEGGYALYVFANNSDGNVTSANVNFSINKNIYNFSYEEYKGDNKGSSTNFSKFSFEDIQNLDNVIFEHTSYGRISFNMGINLTNDIDTTDNFTDFDANTNISNNRIELDEINLPNLDKEAIIIIYNLTFTTPRILKDGSVCNSNICPQNFYTIDGNLSFNVTGFSVYEAEETPGDVEPALAPSGGGGGGGSFGTTRFLVDKELIKVSSKVGETFKISLKITNPTTNSVDFILDSNLNEFVSFSEEEFTIGPNQDKEIFLIFTTTENSIPTVYTGELVVNGNNQLKKIPIIFELESKLVLFDVSLTIPPNYKEVYGKETVKFVVNIFNIGNVVGESEVFIEYMIKDFEGETMVEIEDIIIMEKQASFSKVIRLPDKMTPGSYIAIVQVRYGNGVGTSSEIFHVIEKEKKLTIALTILAIMVFLIIAIKQINLRNRKFKKPKRKDNKLLQVELWKKEGYKTIDVKKK